MLLLSLAFLVLVAGAGGGQAAAPESGECTHTWLEEHGGFNEPTGLLLPCSETCLQSCSENDDEHTTSQVGLQNLRSLGYEDGGAEISHDLSVSDGGPESGVEPAIFLPVMLNEQWQPEQHVTFAVIGDFGLPGDVERSVAELVASWNVDFVATVGDNRYGGNPMDAAVGQYYCDFLTDVGNGTYCAGGHSPINAFFPSPGNHDYNDGGGISEYLGYFTLPGVGVDTLGASGSERYYDVRLGPVHLYFLDSEAATNGSDRAAQKEWLQSALAASTAPWQLVSMHHAPYSSAQHGSQAYMQWPYVSWGADIVLSGHDHVYERLQVGGLPYLVNGLSGSPRIYDFDEPITGSLVRYNEDWGALWVSATDDSVTVRFITRGGEVIDQFTLSQ